FLSFTSIMQSLVNYCFFSRQFHHLREDESPKKPREITDFSRNSHPSFVPNTMKVYCFLLE
ncbi:MAG: hypothetical protein K5856_01665, partial [Bacteroidaceae bacterium]|nr:hypothetical protein [Bacteroidaceae bacterium]